MKCLINLVSTQIFERHKRRKFTHRFEKKIVNREADDSGFCVSIGVLGADPRRQAFSYDVSARKEGMFWNLNLIKFLRRGDNFRSSIASQEVSRIQTSATWNRRIHFVETREKQLNYFVLVLIKIPHRHSRDERARVCVLVSFWSDFSSILLLSDLSSRCEAQFIQLPASRKSEREGEMNSVAQEINLNNHVGFNHHQHLQFY